MLFLPVRKILSKGTGDILSIKKLVFLIATKAFLTALEVKNLNKNNESLRKDYVKCKWRIWPHSKFKCFIFKQKHTRYWSTNVLTLCKRKTEEQKREKIIQFSFSSLELSWPQTASEPTGQFSYSRLWHQAVLQSVFGNKEHMNGIWCPTSQL